MLKTQIKFEKFKNALISLERIYLNPTQEDRVMIDATIQRFEFTFELVWKFLKDYFLEKGVLLNYPKEVMQQIFTVGLINNEGVWIEMLLDRNQNSHTYDVKLADKICERIKLYVPELKVLIQKIEEEIIIT